MYSIFLASARKYLPVELVIAKFESELPALTINTFVEPSNFERSKRCFQSTHLLVRNKALF
jgi:hypothetical protein